jgi:hypothetical protein
MVPRTDEVGRDNRTRALQATLDAMTPAEQVAKRFSGGRPRVKSEIVPPFVAYGAAGGALERLREAVGPEGYAKAKLILSDESTPAAALSLETSDMDASIQILRTTKARVLGVVFVVLNWPKEPLSWVKPWLVDDESKRLLDVARQQLVQEIIATRGTGYSA